MASEVYVYLSIGSNIFPRGVYLATIRKALRERFGEFVKESSIYETTPWGFEADLPFLNQVVLVRTSKSPVEVLREVQDIERGLGRHRDERGYSSRTADIDILLYGEERISTSELQVPHPHMLERRFVLAPLAELDGEGVCASSGKSWRELLEACIDKGEAKRIEDPAERERAMMTSVVADGGATTAKWVSVDATGTKCRYTSRGMNPLYVDADGVEREVRNIFGDEYFRLGVGRVSFYGAACGENQRGDVLLEGLQRVFPLAEVQVDSDMVMAAIATWGHGAEVPHGGGIVAILGTGSNACYLDRGKPVYVTPSVGFLFGDEGSGAWFGKRIVRDWLYSALPKSLEEGVRTMLVKDFGESSLAEMRGMASIVERAYHGVHPSAWFSGFAKVMEPHRGEEYVSRLLAEGFGEFARFFLQPLKEKGGDEVRAVGSVAWYYRDALGAACERVGMRLGKVVKDPLGEVVGW